MDIKRTDEYRELFKFVSDNFYCIYYNYYRKTEQAIDPHSLGLLSPNKKFLFPKCSAIFSKILNEEENKNLVIINEKHDQENQSYVDRENTIHLDRTTPYGLTDKDAIYILSQMLKFPQKSISSIINEKRTILLNLRGIATRSKIICHSESKCECAFEVSAEKMEFLKFIQDKFFIILYSDMDKLCTQRLTDFFLKEKILVVSVYKKNSNIYNESNKVYMSIIENVGKRNLIIVDPTLFFTNNRDVIRPHASFDQIGNYWNEVISILNTIYLNPGIDVQRIISKENAKLSNVGLEEVISLSKGESSTSILYKQRKQLFQLNRKLFAVNEENSDDSDSG